MLITGHPGLKKSVPRPAGSNGNYERQRPAVQCKSLTRVVSGDEKNILFQCINCFFDNGRFFSRVICGTTGDFFHYGEEDFFQAGDQFLEEFGR